MFSPRVFTMMALLAVCAAGSIGPAADSTADRPVDRTGHRENGTFPLRSKYNKDRKANSLKDIINEAFKKQKDRHRSWNRVVNTDKNRRVFTKVKGYKRSELRVVVENNWLKASGNSHGRVHNIHTEPLPAHAVVSAISATLTSDGYLVVDIPIDKRAPKSSQRKRNVPIVESGKPLDSKHLNISYFYSDSSYSHTSLNTEKDWIKLEKDHRPWDWIEATDKNIRVIMKVEGYKRSELRVHVKNNNWVKASGNSATALLQMFIHTEPLPANAVVSAINATLTSDGYLVVDIPIDERAPKSSQRERNVPIVESGEPLDSIYLNITHLYGDNSNSHTSLNIEKDWIKLKNDHTPWNSINLEKDYRPWNWIEATDKNIRVIMKVEGYKRSELRVRVKNNWVKASGNSSTALVQMFIHTEPLPANVVVSAINATLTSDGYLVVDIPIDKRAPKSSQRERNVPIVESGKPLDSKHLNITHLYGDHSNSHTSLNIEKDWIKLEKDHRPWNWIEATDKNIRVIIKFEGYKRSELRVRVKNNWVKASGKSSAALVQMLKHTEPLPANAVVSAINATLTSDGYLVVDIPIDERAGKSSQRERNVPIVESGKPLDSKYLIITHLYGDNSNSHTSLNIEDWIKLEKDRPWNWINLEKDYRPWNWIEATEKNIRVITKVEGYKRSELRVRVNNWLKASGNSHATESVYNNNMFTLTKPLPANAVVSAINATLTSDEYLVLDIPIDKRAPKSSQRERNVPIVESGKPLDSIYLNITHLYGDSSYSDSSDTSLDTSTDTSYSHGD